MNPTPSSNQPNTHSRSLGEWLFRTSIYLGMALSGLALITMLLYMVREASPALQQLALIDFIFGQDWNPTEYGTSFQIANIIMVSLLVSCLASLLVLPLAFGISCFIQFFSSKRVGQGLRSLLSMMAGIPSIIYGFFGMRVIVP